IQDPIVALLGPVLDAVPAVRRERASGCASSVITRVVERPIVALLGYLEDAVATPWGEPTVGIAGEVATAVGPAVALLGSVDDAIAAVGAALAVGQTTVVRGRGVGGCQIARSVVALLAELRLRLAIAADGDAVGIA